MPTAQMETVSVEMTIIIFVAVTIFGLMLGGLGYFIRCQFERILDRLDELDQQRITCRESLPDRFADKKETREAIQRIHDRADNHDHRITVLEQQIH